MGAACRTYMSVVSRVWSVVLSVACVMQWIAGGRQHRRAHLLISDAGGRQHRRAHLLISDAGRRQHRRAHLLISDERIVPHNVGGYHIHISWWILYVHTRTCHVYTHSYASLISALYGTTLFHVIHTHLHVTYTHISYIQTYMSHTHTHTH